MLDLRQRERLHKALVGAFDITTWEPIQSFYGMHIEYDIEAGVLEMNMTNKIESLFNDLHPTLGQQINGNAKVPLKGGDYANVSDELHKMTRVLLAN